MTQEEMSVREKILLATVNLIEKEGIHAVTTRGVAKEANVNSAAINYYFGTKEKLLDETLKYTLNNAAVDTDEFINDKNQDLPSVLKTLFTYYLEGFLRYPGITKAHFYDAFVHNNYEGVAMKWVNSMANTVIDKIKTLAPEMSESEIKLAVMQMLSAIFLPGLFQGMFKGFSETDFKDPEKQREYVDYLVGKYFRR